MARRKLEETSKDLSKSLIGSMIPLEKRKEKGSRKQITNKREIDYHLMMITMI